MKIDIEKTFIKSVGENSDFHFYLDELAGNDSMPTYQGIADGKYSFDEIDDEFFSFIQSKISADGVFIRLVLASAKPSEGHTVFHLEYGDETSEFVGKDRGYEFADYGVKVKGSDVVFGMAVVDGICNNPVFLEFESSDLSNPLNQMVLEIMKDFIVCEV